jgi:hypothetical protein
LLADRFAGDRGMPVAKKQSLIIAGLAGAGLFVVVILTLAGPVLKHPPREAPKAPKGWSREGIKAVYVATQLREVDKAHSSLILSYDLNNLTDLDYRIAEGAGVVILSRLKSDGSLSQQEAIRLNYPVFLPAKQRARLAIEISRTFAWPARDDSHYDEKLREFVRQRLTDVGGFVLFDETSHSQIDLPAAWPELQDTKQAGG